MLSMTSCVSVLHSLVFPERSSSMAWPSLWWTLLAEGLELGMRLRKTFWLLSLWDLALISCVSKKKNGPGDDSALCSLFFVVLWRPQVAKQILVSHRLLEKSMFPSSLAGESSETLFPRFTSSRKGSSCDQACCTVWGSTHRSAWGAVWRVPSGAMHLSLGVTPLLWTAPVRKRFIRF